MSTGVYDAIDLKDQIRKLKVIRAQLENERIFLEEEARKGETQLSVLRQEYNLLAPTDEIRFTADEPENGEISLIDNKKFKQLNQKLDMQILIGEIRSSLPHLEAEVAKWESRVKGTTKTASRSEKEEQKFPPLLLKSSGEIDEIIGSKFEEQFRLKAQITNDLTSIKQTKQQLANEIAHARRTLSTLYEEKELIILGNKNIDTALYQEQVQLEILKKQHIEAREALGLCHNGNGWKTEAYLTITDKVTNTVSVSKLPRLLSQWIICSDHANTINPGYIQELLHNIQQQNNEGTIKESAAANNNNTKSRPKGGNTRKSMDSLYILSDDESDRPATAAVDDEQEEDELIVMKPTTKNNKTSVEVKGIENTITNIDFMTFCKLCDRIIILNESQ